MKATVISDTHGEEPELEGGDILFHAGDLSINGFRVEIIKALNYLHEQLDKYKYVVLTPGNHDLWCERHPEEFRKACEMAGIILLVNEGIEIEGKKIWASPVTAVHHNWAFNEEERKRKFIFDRIPQGLDLLMTHEPAFGKLDKTSKDLNIGCISLLEKIDETNPKIHLFGHVHESAGTLVEEKTIFINAATKVINFEF